MYQDWTNEEILEAITEVRESLNRTQAITEHAIYQRDLADMQAELDRRKGLKYE